MKKQLYGIHTFVLLLNAAGYSSPFTPKEARNILSTFASKNKSWYRAPAIKGVDRMLRVLTQGGVLKHNKKTHSYALTSYGVKVAVGLFS